MVQSFVTANGTETPDEWYSYISALHGDMSQVECPASSCWLKGPIRALTTVRQHERCGWQWDQFMHYGTTFHASQLDDHLTKFQKDEVPLIARKSSLSGANEVHLYSLLVQTPSGKVPLPILQAVALSLYSCV